MLHAVLLALACERALNFNLGRFVLKALAATLWLSVLPHHYRRDYPLGWAVAAPSVEARH